MIERPGSPDSSGAAGKAQLKLLARLGDLADRAHAALDAGDTEAALEAIERRSALLERERSTLEWLAESPASRGGRNANPAPVSADELYVALRDTLRRHSLLTERLRAAGGEVADELARLDAGRRTIRAYGRADLLPPSALDGERSGG